jgi:hypothetical protein
MKTKRDETLEEIWAIRRRLAEKFDYDPKKAGEYYRRRQKAAGVKIYQREEEFAPAADALVLRETPPGKG